MSPIGFIGFPGFIGFIGFFGFIVSGVYESITGLIVVGDGT